MPSPSRRPPDQTTVGSAPGTRWLWPAVAGFGWAWAVALVSLRQHDLFTYTVMPSVPPAWGAVAVSGPMFVLILVTAAGLVSVAGCSRRVFSPATRWLMLACAIPGLDVLRAFGLDIPLTVLEPLFLAAVTGAAVATGFAAFYCRPKSGDHSPHSKGRTDFRRAFWFVATCCLTAAMAGWWYWQGQQAYRNYLLGFNDFGIYAWRVVNTWRGRGFLMETPSLPAFYDHFNPSLALVVPFWGLWPDSRLFILLQAVSLALPGVFVYGIVRSLGGSRPTALVWAAAYMVYPAVGQLNLSYSYGWHPVTTAMTLVFAAVFALLRGWRTAAAICAVIACGFQEDVLVVTACLTMTMGIQAWLLARRGRERSARNPSGVAPLAGQLSWPTWLVLTALLAVAFVAIYRLAPFSRFQTERFTGLGHSVGEIVFSPVLHPVVFWSYFFHPMCGYLLLALSVPLGLRNLARGWRVLLAAALPLAVLFAWDLMSAKSLAFWYYTMVVPIFLLSAIVGASDGDRAAVPEGEDASSRPSRQLSVGGMTALAAGAVASVALGATPWSTPTLNDLTAMTYRTDDVVRNRMAGSAGNAAINQMVARIDVPDERVLATGRIAAHLLGVDRLETVARARDRWAAFQAEVGSGHSPLELFNWIVLDTKEQFLQSDEDIQFIRQEAREAGFRQIQAEYGVLLLARERRAERGR